MSANTKVVKPVIRAGNSSLMRPRFSPGLLLRDDDLNQAVDYTRDLSRLLFRSLVGCGVVCGLKVSTEFKCEQLVVTVACGIALDCHGDPIYVPDPQQIPIDSSCGQTILDEMWVVIRRTEKCCAPRVAACSCDDEETPAVCTRERDGYEIRIVQTLPDHACGCTEAKTRDRVIQPPPAPQQPADPPPKLKAAKKGEADIKAADSTHPADGGPLPAGPVKPDDCQCADASLACNEDYRLGLCGCDCADCNCEWVVLALVKRQVKDGKVTNVWATNHSVRRFVRPVLMRDPVAWLEMHPGA
jgi:hypothetical protein